MAPATARCREAMIVRSRARVIGRVGTGRNTNGVCPLVWNICPSRRRLRAGAVHDRKVADAPQRAPRERVVDGAWSRESRRAPRVWLVAASLVGDHRAG